MIPIKDIIPPRSRPLVAMILLVVGAFEFVVERSLGYPVSLPLLALGANMLGLWLFADNVEDRLGHVRFLVFYVVCGITGMMAQQLAASGPGLPVVLASGAVGGVVGGYFALYPRSRVLMLVPIPWTVVEVPAIFFLGVYVVLHAPEGIGPLAPALAGLAAGASLSLLLRRPMVW